MVSNLYQLEQIGPVWKVRMLGERSLVHDRYVRQRGDIFGFSRCSQERLAVAVAAFEEAAVNKAMLCFATVTFGAKWPSRFYDRKGRRSFAVVKRKFLHALRRLEFCSGEQQAWLWRLEVQPKRGAPHFHLVGAFPCDLRTVRLAIQAAWKVAVGEWWVPEMDGVCVDVSYVRSSGKVASYLCKELGKTMQVMCGLGAGRCWGIIGRKLIRFGLPVIRRLDGRAYFRLRMQISELNRQGMGIAKEKWDAWRGRSWVISDTYVPAI